jgi:hypothetical protein
MNTFIYIGTGFLCLGWLVLLILSMNYQFKNDAQDKLHSKSLPKTNPDNPSETSTPE